MTTDAHLVETYRALREPCDGLLPDESLDDYDASVNEEPYYTLSWLIADILENNTPVPSDLLLEGYSLLENREREEYSSQLDEWLRSPTNTTA